MHLCICLNGVEQLVGRTSAFVKLLNSFLYPD